MSKKSEPNGNPREYELAIEEARDTQIRRSITVAQHLKPITPKLIDQLSFSGRQAILPRMVEELGEYASIQDGVFIRMNRIIDPNSLTVQRHLVPHLQGHFDVLAATDDDIQKIMRSTFKGLEGLSDLWRLYENSGGVLAIEKRMIIMMERLREILDLLDKRILPIAVADAEFQAMLNFDPIDTIPEPSLGQKSDSRKSIVHPKGYASAISHYVKTMVGVSAKEGSLGIQDIGVQVEETRKDLVMVNSLPGDEARAILDALLEDIIVRLEVMCFKVGVLHQRQVDKIFEGMDLRGLFAEAMERLKFLVEELEADRQKGKMARWAEKIRDSFSFLGSKEEDIVHPLFKELAEPEMRELVKRMRKMIKALEARSFDSFDW